MTSIFSESKGHLKKGGDGKDDHSLPTRRFSSSIGEGFKGAQLVSGTRPISAAHLTPSSSMSSMRDKMAFQRSRHTERRESNHWQGTPVISFRLTKKNAKAPESSLHTTGTSKAVATKSERDSKRFHLCMEALSQGCVETYIHLYGIFHRPPVCVDELSQTFFTIPEERMAWVQECMCSIELLRRQSEFRAVFEKCQELAQYFEEVRDVEEATWHYEAALRYAMEALEHDLIRDVRYAFAQFYERTGRLRQACDMYGSIYDGARALGKADVAKATCVELVRVFQLLGDEVRESDSRLGKRYYERSVRFAKQSESGLQEALAYAALGSMNEQLNDLHEALHYHTEWSNVAKREGMGADECRAELKKASLQERLHRNQEAMTSLDRAFTLAKEMDDDSKVCRAMMQLGEVYRSEGRSEEAMTCFKESFAAARRAGDQGLTDSSRVAMGFAIGEFYFTHAGNNRGYLPIVCEDIEAQLHWMSKGEL